VSNAELSVDDRELRDRVARWTEDAQRLTAWLKTAGALAARAHAAEERIAWLDRQVALLMDENKRLREERRDIAEAARKLVDFQKLNYVLQQLSK
jgi:hypothetical protein